MGLLGGHEFKTHVDTSVLKFFRDNFNAKTLIDIGCGPGGQCYEAIDVGYEAAHGIDGDPVLNWDLDKLGLTWTRHDFSTGAYEPRVPYDLAWSCEFVEHVDEEYIPNFMPCFQAAKYVAMTYHPPCNKPNPYHVNEQPEEYWLDVFKKYGFEYQPTLTTDTRAISSQTKKFFKRRGLVFKNEKFN